MVTGAVVLEERVEQAVFWLFCTVGGVGVCCVPEEEVVRRLRGRFAAWKVCDGLKRLQSAGVAAPVTRVIGGVNRRCWTVRPEAWERIEPFDPPLDVEV